MEIIKANDGRGFVNGIQISARQMQIVEAMIAMPEDKVDTDQIAEAVDLTYGTVYVHLGRLVYRGVVKREQLKVSRIGLAKVGPRIYWSLVGRIKKDNHVEETVCDSGRELQSGSVQ